MTGDGQSGVLI